MGTENVNKRVCVDKSVMAEFPFDKVVELFPDKAELLYKAVKVLHTYGYGIRTREFFKNFIEHELIFKSWENLKSIIYEITGDIELKDMLKVIVGDPSETISANNCPLDKTPSDLKALSGDISEQRWWGSVKDFKLGEAHRPARSMHDIIKDIMEQKSASSDNIQVLLSVLASTQEDTVKHCSILINEFMLLDKRLEPVSYQDPSLATGETPGGTMCDRTESAKEKTVMALIEDRIREELGVQKLLVRLMKHVNKMQNNLRI